MDQLRAATFNMPGASTWMVVLPLTSARCSGLRTQIVYCSHVAAVAAVSFAAAPAGAATSELARANGSANTGASRTARERRVVRLEGWVISVFPILRR
ncbi:hypothetical protein NS183_08100 [Microbacterium testaceum]|nr:hypothetical protein NS183_08100 [Microbacterium testaceum]